MRGHLWAGGGLLRSGLEGEGGGEGAGDAVGREPKEERTQVSRRPGLPGRGGQSRDPGRLRGRRPPFPPRSIPAPGPLARARGRRGVPAPPPRAAT